MRRLCVVLILLVLSSPIATPAAAQDSASTSSVSLSLEQARAIAAENNPAYRQSRNNLETARARERQSVGAFLPTLNLSASSNGSLSRILTGEDEYGKPVRRPDPLELRGSGSSQSVSLGLTLFDGGGRYRELSATRAQGAATRAAVAMESNTMDAELARRYYEAQRTAELIGLEEDLLAARQELYAATEELLRVAVRSPIDLLGAEIDVAAQESALESARGAARKAVLALAEEMGVADPPDWELTTEPPAVFDPAMLDTDSLVTRALTASPDIRQRQASLRAAEQTSRAAGASRWPTVRASASFSRSVGTEGYGSLFDVNPLNQGLGFGLSVSLPVFTGFQISTQIVQARVAAENAREDLRAARLGRERQVRSAFIELQNQYSAVQLAERRRDLARRRMDLANRQFRLGSLDFTDLQGVNQQAADAESTAINARYDFAAALIALEESVGGDPQ